MGCISSPSPSSDDMAIVSSGGYVGGMGDMGGDHGEFE